MNFFHTHYQVIHSTYNDAGAARSNEKETTQQSITYKDNTPLTVATVMLVVVAAIAVGSAIIIGLYVLNHWRRRHVHHVHSTISFDYT